ncbi:MAG: LamG-like jellyroll fold domain-containing protein, partial [Cytophagales bacterium]
MKKLFLACILGMLSHAFAQRQNSSGHFVRLEGTIANEHLNMGAALNDSLATSNFTIETWMFVNSTNSDPAWFGNKNWDSGNNIGIVLANTSATTFKVNARFGSGTRFDLNSINVPQGIVGRWNHIAVVFDRNGSTPRVIAYVNGVQAASGNLTAAMTPTATLKGALNFRLGQDGTGSYAQKFNGGFDEFRIWKGVRPLDSLRRYMCQSITNEADKSNLLVYYDFNENNGSLVKNKVGNAVIDARYTKSGALTNALWQVSSVPVGNRSAFAYGNYTNPVSVSSSGYGTLSLSNISNTNGVHVYAIDSVLPEYRIGLPNPKENYTLFGYFATNVSASTTMDVKLDYTDFEKAVTDSNSIQLFNRLSSWEQTVGFSNTKKSFTKTVTNNSNAQLMIASFALETCNAPTAFKLEGDPGFTKTNLSWISNSGSWVMEYSTVPFNPGFSQGTTVKGVGGLVNFTLSGLNPDQEYYVYVKDTCSSIGSASDWVGPISFKTKDLVVSAPSYSYNFTGSQRAISSNVINHNIGTGDFTLEAWVFQRARSGANGVMAFGNSSLVAAPAFYSKTGGSGGNGSVGIWWAGGIGWKNTKHFLPENQWSHIAMVRKGAEVRIYVNGVFDGTVISIPANASVPNGTFYLGHSNDLSEFLNGSVDEVRVWKKARTEDEIRNLMCRRAIGNEDGLFMNFSFDEGEGQPVDRVSNVTLNNSVSTHNYWSVSGAFVGDTSVYMYPEDANWTGNQVFFDSEEYQIKVVDIKKTKGIQLLSWKNGLKSTQVSLPSVGSNVFGVFPTSADTASYTILSQSDLNNNTLALLNKKAPNSPLYSITPLANNSKSKHLFGYSVLSFGSINSNCDLLFANEISQVSSDQVSIKWSTSPNPVNAIYSFSPFTLGIGSPQAINGITVDSILISELVVGRNYELYLNTQCANDEKLYSGPYYFSSLPCTAPTNVIVGQITGRTVALSWDNNVFSSYKVTWAPKGTNPNLGIDRFVSTNSITLTNLPRNSEIDVYIYTMCNSTLPSSQFVKLEIKLTDPVCEAPKNVQIINVSSSKIDLNWDANFYN